MGKRELDSGSLAKCHAIVSRLSSETEAATQKSGERFLSEEFQIPDLDNLPVDPPIAQIIRDRMREAQICLDAGAYLSVIFLCGSVLEAVLLGVAKSEPRKFNQSASSPKHKDDKVKQFHEWTLSDLINVALDVGLLRPDVQKFSHGLRDFRNYIHPHQQIASGFAPDQHTAGVCFQVLTAAMADVSGERQRPAVGRRPNHS